MGEVFEDSLERSARKDALRAVIDHIDRLSSADAYTLTLEHDPAELVLDPSDDNYPVRSWVNELNEQWILDQGVQVALGVPSEFTPSDTDAKIQAIYAKSPSTSRMVATELTDPATGQDIETMILRVYDASADEYITEHRLTMADDEIETAYRLINAKDEILAAKRFVRPRHDELLERVQRLFTDRSTLVDVADLLRGEVNEEDITAVVKGIKRGYGDDLPQEINDLLDEVKARAWAVVNPDTTLYPMSELSVAELMDLNKQLSQL